MRLENRVAVVTGGGRGIGKGIVLKLAEEGADIVIATKSVEPAGDVLKAVEQLGRRAALGLRAGKSQLASERRGTMRDAGLFGTALVRLRRARDENRRRDGDDAAGGGTVRAASGEATCAVRGAAGSRPAGGGDLAAPDEVDLNGRAQQAAHLRATSAAKWNGPCLDDVNVRGRTGDQARASPIGRA